MFVKINSQKLEEKQDLRSSNPLTKIHIICKGKGNNFALEKPDLHQPNGLGQQHQT